MFHCAFHSAAHVSQCFAVRFTAFHRPCALSLQPKVRHGQFPTSNANLLALHNETLLQDCPRRKCLKTTHNSNSAFSSRASFQDQTRQLGPPQYQSDNSPFFVIEGGRQCMDTCPYSFTSLGCPMILHLNGRITYRPLFRKILECHTMLLT